MIASRFPANLPPVFSEEPKQYFLQIELPGFAKHQVGVLVEDGLLSITLGHGGFIIARQYRDEQVSPPSGRRTLLGGGGFPGGGAAGAAAEIFARAFLVATVSK